MQNESYQQISASDKNGKGGQTKMEGLGGGRGSHVCMTVPSVCSGKQVK